MFLLVVWLLTFHSTGHRQIQSLTVACENKQDGCYWRGDLSSLKGHLLGKCLYRPTECPYCNCMLKMINIESHKRKVCMSRPYSCSYCGEKNSYRYIKHWHNPVTCPNSGCRELVCSAMLKDHVAMECDFSLVDCECKEIGCKEQLMRKDMVQHENSHLKDLLKENSELKKYVAYLEMDTDRRKEEYQESVSHLKMDLDRQKEDNQALQEQMNAIIRKMYKQDYYYLITLFLVVISSLILMDFFNVL